MPKTLVLGNIGNKGLNTDQLPWELAPDFLTFGVNFRIFAGSIRSSGGWRKWTDAPSQLPAGTFYPGYLMHVGATSGEYWMVAGRDRVFVFDGQVWTDISYQPYGMGTGDELLWTGCMLGQIPLINNPSGTYGFPQYWSPVSPGQLLQILPFDQANTWEDVGYRCKIFRSHKNFLFALNLQEGVTEFPDSFRWSHPADINGLPPTWDETNEAFLAGKAALGGDGGEIIDAQSIKDAMCIYSENAIDILDYTNDEFVWRRRELTATIGLLASNALVEVKGKHFFLGDGDIVVNDGYTVTSIAHNRIRRQLNARISVDYYNRAYAIRNDSVKEVWFCVPEDEAEYPNVAYIYNWRDDSWSIRGLPYELQNENIVSAVSFGNYGSQSDPVRTWDSFADNNKIINSGFESTDGWNIESTGQPEIPYSWFIEDGVARCIAGTQSGGLWQTATEQVIYQDNPVTYLGEFVNWIRALTAGLRYTITYTVKRATAGSIRVRLGTSFANESEGQWRFGVGTYTETLTAVASGDSTSNIYFDTSNFDGEIDDVFLTEEGKPSETWDSISQVWGSAERTPLDDTVVGCDIESGDLIILDPQDTPDNEIAARIERTDFPLEGHTNVTTITRIYPHIQGTQPMEIQVGSQDHANAPIRWKAPIRFDPDENRKIDVRTTGELHAWRMQSIGKNNWQMSGMTIEYEDSGKR